MPQVPSELLELTTDKELTVILSFCMSPYLPFFTPPPVIPELTERLLYFCCEFQYCSFC